MSLEAGQLLDRYKLIRKAGAGGMAEVWEAFDEGLDRTVAIKIMAGDTSGDSEYVRRFFREAKIVARMDHPNILPVFDVGEVEGRPYLVMPFIANGTLKDRMQRSVPPEEALQWLAQAAAGLDHAHKLGVLHRDIKPANLLFNKSGALCLADFGLARSSEQTHAITVPGVVMGTPSYISPDQIVSDDVTPAADQYSLAVVAFELLTGKLPFMAPSSFLLLNKHVNEAPARATSIREELPSAVDAVFDRALAKQPGARFASCSAFVNALSDVFSPATEKLSRPPAPQDDGEVGTVRLDVLAKPSQPATVTRPVEPSHPTAPTSLLPRPTNIPESKPALRHQAKPAVSVFVSTPAPAPAPSGSRLPWLLVVLLLLFIGGVFLWLRDHQGIPGWPGSVLSPSPIPAGTVTSAAPVAIPASTAGEPVKGAELGPTPAEPSTAPQMPVKIVELAPTAGPTETPAPTPIAETKPTATREKTQTSPLFGSKNLESFHISAVRQTRVVNGQAAISTSWKLTLVYKAPLPESAPEPEVVSAWLSGPAGKKSLFSAGTKGKVQSGGAGQKELVLFFDGEAAAAALDPGFDAVDFTIRLGSAELSLSGELRSR